MGCYRQGWDSVITYLRITRQALPGLLLSLVLASRIHGVESLLLLLLNLTRVGAVVVLVVDFVGFGAGVNGLAVLTHAEVDLSLADVGTDELGVLLDGHVAVLKGAGELEELHESSSTVAVATGILRGTLDHLRVSSNGAGPVHLLELLVTLLTSLLGLDGVDVGLAGGLDLVAFSGAHLVEDIRGTVLAQTLVVEVNRIGEVTLLLIGRTNARQGLGNDLEVSIGSAALLSSLLAGFNASLVVALLEVGGAEVVEVDNVLVQVPSGLVVLDGLVEVALLVVLGAKGLLLIGRLLSLLLLQLLLIHLRLRLRLRSLGLWWLLLLRGGSISHLDVFLGGALRGRVPQLHIYTHQDTKDLDHPRVGEEVLCVRWVLLDGLELGHEGGVREEGSRLGVAGQLLDKVGVGEHLSNAAAEIAASLLRHGTLNSLVILLHASIVRIDLEALLVSIVGAQQVTLAEERCALAAPTLGPVGLDLGGLLGILQSIVPVLLGGVCGRTVAVEDVVGRVEGNGLCELVTIKGTPSQPWSGNSEDRHGVSGRAYMASSKFFSAMALLPRALSSSAVDIMMCGYLY